MPRKLFDPYAVLGLPRTATPSEITNAYRKHVRALHPDTRTAPQSAADEQLQRVLAAYALLRDPERRARYDRLVTRNALAANSAGRVRIPGLTVEFRVKWLSG